jgi:hypothetical protein
MTQFLTIGQVAQEVNSPIWKVRRIVDDLCRDLPRAGLYRLVPLDMLPAIRERAAATKEAAALVQELHGRGLNVTTADKLEGAQQR